jgi:hypothetical protein
MLMETTTAKGGMQAAKEDNIDVVSKDGLLLR